MLLFLSKNRVRSCCKVFEWPSLRAASAVLWLFSNPLEQMLQKCLATNTIILKRPTRIHKRIMRQSSTLSVFEFLFIDFQDFSMLTASYTKFCISFFFRFKSNRYAQPPTKKFSSCKVNMPNI